MTNLMDYSESLEMITNVLSNPETLKKFRELYPRVIEDRDERLHFNMSASHSESADYALERSTYNNHIISLFYGYPNWGKGFSEYPHYKITAGCWKGGMYIYCCDMVLTNLYGWGTRDIIARIFGYNNIGEIK